MGVRGILQKGVILDGILRKKSLNCSDLFPKILYEILSLFTSSMELVRGDIKIVSL